MNISILTTILREDNLFLNAVEKYAWFGGKVVEVVVDGPDVSIGLLREHTTSLLETSWKVASMMITLGLSLVIALAIRTISRQINKPVVIDPTTKRPIVAPTKEIEQAYRQCLKANTPFYQHFLAKAAALEKGQPIPFDRLLLADHLKSFDCYWSKLNRSEEAMQFYEKMDCSILQAMAVRYRHNVITVSHEKTHLIATAIAQAQIEEKRSQQLQTN